MLVYDGVALAQCLARLDVTLSSVTLPPPLRKQVDIDARAIKDTPPARVEFCAVGFVLAPLVPSSAAWPF